MVLIFQRVRIRNSKFSFLSFNDSLNLTLSISLLECIQNVKNSNDMFIILFIYKRHYIKFSRNN